MPRIAFVAGTDGTRNLGPEPVKGPTPILDARFGNFLGVTPSPDINLDTYSLDASFTRTDINGSITDGHTHECTVDNNGNGATARTIRLGTSTEPDHTHVITSYITDMVLAHTHEVRCVGITNILPMTNTVVKIRVIGYALYDPTLCLPNSRGTGSFVPDYLFPPDSKVVTQYTYYQAQKN